VRPACLKSPKLAAFADVWHKLRQRSSQGLPSNEDFPLEDLAPYLPNLAVTRRRVDGTPYYHFYGTELAIAFGDDATGRDVFSNMTDEARAQFLKVIASADAKEKQGISINGRWYLGQATTKDGCLVEVEGLTLPFTAKDGEIRRATYNAVIGTVALGDALGAHYPKTDGIEFDALQERPDWMYLQTTAAAAE
jgi:hypothetical protein